MKKNKVNELMAGGMMIALGLIIPIIFHAFSLLGKIFLPMHIPILIGGFFLSPPIAFMVGILTPLLSGAITGMPEIFPMGIIMMFELGIYGLVASILSRKSKKVYWDILITLSISMILGRIVAGATVFFLSNFFGVKMDPFLFLKGAIITGIPGIIVQFMFIPAIILGLKKILVKETI